ncbi:MAG TPA: hypothetical protein VFO82_17060 [Steroidobacteraceae bacterium]|nr:hypothetical protein [Steroidobacteraceae bacterium]
MQHQIRAAMPSLFFAAIPLLAGCDTSDPSPGQQDFTYSVESQAQSVAPGETRAQQVVIADLDYDGFDLIDDGSPYIGEVGLAVQSPAPAFGLTLGDFAPPSLTGPGSSALTLNAAPDAALAVHQLVIESTLLNVEGVSAADLTRVTPVEARVTAACVPAAARATAIVAGQGIGCCSGRSGALAEDGGLYTWGANASGSVETANRVELVVPSVRAWLAPFRVPLPAFDNSSSLALDSNRLFALRGGVAHLVGSYFHASAEAPDGRTGFASSTITGIPVPVTAVAPSSLHSLALGADGSVWAWGNNDFGALGDGTTTSSDVPVPVDGLTNVIAIATGDSHSVALRADGTVWTWGGNPSGVLGTDTTTARSLPGQVAGLNEIIAIAGRHLHVLALRRDGTVWAWGNNRYGQLADDTQVFRPTPMRIDGLSSVVGVLAQSFHSLAVLGDGSVWGWGSNGRGQLGDGTEENSRLMPVQALGITNVVAIAGGRDHTLALRSDGSVWAWGENADGELGDGTTMNRLTPVPVLGFGPPGPTICPAPPASPPPSPPPPAAQFTLTVTKLGPPNSLVRSTPVGIECGFACVADFESDQTVRLTTLLAAGSRFSGWSGCDREPAGANPWPDCEVDMNADREVQARAE